MKLFFFNDKNLVTEGSSSSVFIAKAGELLTAPKSANILPSITRDFVIDNLASKAAIKVKEKSFTIEDLKQADEVFLVSTTLLIMPVARVGDVSIGDGKSGVITNKLIKLFSQELEKISG